MIARLYLAELFLGRSPAELAYLRSQFIQFLIMTYDMYDNLPNLTCVPFHGKSTLHVANFPS